jgi:hypothetical protein
LSGDLDGLLTCCGIVALVEPDALDSSNLRRCSARTAASWAVMLLTAFPMTLVSFPFVVLWMLIDDAASDVDGGSLVVQAKLNCKQRDREKRVTWSNPTFSLKRNDSKGSSTSIFSSSSICIHIHHHVIPIQDRFKG